MEPSGSRVPEEAMRMEVFARLSAQACGVMGRRMDFQVSNAASALVEDTLGNLWIGSDTAVVRWKPGSSSTRTWGLKSVAGMDGVEGLAANPDGSVWVGIALAGLGLQQLVQGNWKPFVTPELDGSTLVVRTLFRDRENALWIGTTNQGIYRILGRKVDHFHSTDGLSSDWVLRFYEDREGNLWVATSKGIDCFRDLRVATLLNPRGTNHARSGFRSRRARWHCLGGRRCCFGCHSSGTGSLPSKREKACQGIKLPHFSKIHAGRLWVGIDKTMSIYRNGRFTKIDRPDGSPIGLVTGMTEDVDNNIWVETIGPPRTLSRIRDLKVQDAFSGTADAGGPQSCG